MRLFVGVMTPAAVDDAIDAVLDAAVMFRAREAGIDRWIPRDERHLTLRFVGETDARSGLDDALAAAIPGLPAPRFLVGPAAVALSAQVVAVPVQGADALARAVDEALAPLGLAPRDRPFTGHVTVARSRHRMHGAAAHAALAHAPIAVPWQPTALEVIASEPAGDPRYRVLARHIVAA